MSIQRVWFVATVTFLGGLALLCALTGQWVSTLFWLGTIALVWFVRP